MFTIWIVPWWLALIILWMNAKPLSERHLWDDDFRRECRWIKTDKICPHDQATRYFKAGLAPKQAAKTFDRDVEAQDNAIEAERLRLSAYRLLNGSWGAR